MSDEQNAALIERLRAVVKRAWSWDYHYPGNLNIESLIVDLRKEAREAAAEIERLQRLVSAQAQDILTLGQLAGRAAELEARIAALEEHASAQAQDFDALAAMQAKKVIARAALAKGEVK